jgi:hypothetical protein
MPKTQVTLPLPDDEALLCLYADEALPIIAAMRHCQCDADESE